jgi:D-tyrosyl-tRNA(Tyr) deacylase
MRILIQRVRSGRVRVDDHIQSEIAAGLVILVGVGQLDSTEEADYLAEKAAHLRIFEDQAGKTNLSVLDVGGEALVVSQFTLYADTRKGRRPSFVQAALPEAASPLIARFARRLNELGVPTQTGSFGAHMLVEIVNDGPMTIFIER